jgi:hypothetical protein
MVEILNILFGHGGTHGKCQTCVGCKALKSRQKASGMLGTVSKMSKFLDNVENDDQTLASLFRLAFIFHALSNLLAEIFKIRMLQEKVSHTRVKICKKLCQLHEFQQRCTRATPSI